MKKDYYKILDEVLETIYKNETNPNQLENSRMTFSIIKDIYKLSESEWSEIFSKLFTDKLIKYDEISNFDYKMTFEGFVFYQDGKYRAKNRNENIKKAGRVVNLVLLSIAAFVTIWYYGHELYHSQSNTINRKTNKCHHIHQCRQWLKQPEW